MLAPADGETPATKKKYIALKNGNKVTLPCEAVDDDSITHFNNRLSRTLDLVKSLTPKSLISRSLRVISPMVRAYLDHLPTFVRRGLNLFIPNLLRLSSYKFPSDRHKHLLKLKQQATSYDDWKTAARELDILENHDEWKRTRQCNLYDVTLVESRLKQLDEARQSNNVDRMLHLIRTSFMRNLGGMGHASLYQHSHIGTKALIEQYIESARLCIAAVCKAAAESDCDAKHTRYILDQMMAARQAFGRSALLLSGGGSFGMSHIGVVKCLWEERLLPRIISGSSAGSIISAVLCSRTDDEMLGLIDEFCFNDFNVFDQQEEHGVLRKTARLLKYGAVFDIENLARIMQSILGDLTFQEAYNRTRRVLNVNVSTASVYELPRLLNYITAPNVLIWSAVAASCSVPLIFSSMSLLAKDPKTGETVPWNPSPNRWIDGSVDNDLPMTRLAEMFNVNHFIVSQVNPHVVLFLEKDSTPIPPFPSSKVSASSPASKVTTFPRLLNNLAVLVKDEILHRMLLLAELGIFPTYFTKMRSVLSQRYYGDITILPEIPLTRFTDVLKNPTPSSTIRSIIAGERASWAKISRIQNHCAIEMALDDAVQNLRAQVVSNLFQKDLSPY